MCFADWAEAVFQLQDEIIKDVQDTDQDEAGCDPVLPWMGR